MHPNFRFAVMSDLHIGLPHTIQDNPYRFHLVDLSIPALESVLDHLSQLDLDFLLVPGDLTQDGEPDNHTWLSQRLAQLPYPAYVIPGNHDVLSPQRTDVCIGLDEFPNYYPKAGYHNPDRLYYTCELLPGVRLIALNSNQFSPEGQQLGVLDQTQLAWVEAVLQAAPDQLVMVMVHHNVLEHLPNQSRHGVGQRYMLDNAADLATLLQTYGVQLVFTGHLHVQNIAHHQGLFDITTGSLVSFPHPYRVIEVTSAQSHTQVEIESYRVQAVPGWPDLQAQSRALMCDRSTRFMTHFLCHPPLSLSPQEARHLAPQVQSFWPDVADGDPALNFPGMPPAVQQFFHACNISRRPHRVVGVGDNRATIMLRSMG